MTRLLHRGFSRRMQAPGLLLLAFMLAGILAVPGAPAAERRALHLRTEGGNLDEAGTAVAVIRVGYGIPGRFGLRSNTVVFPADTTELAKPGNYSLFATKD